MQASENTMAILIKCNNSDLLSGEEQTFILPKEKGLGLTRAQEAFVWVSERPREGRPEGSGLRMHGTVISWQPADGGRTSVTIQVRESVSTGLSMDALGEFTSDVARRLHRRVHGMRHRRIWGLSPAEDDVLREAFETFRG
jgi:hypothetical protein